MAIDNTIGGTDSNSYVSIIEADTYCLERGYSSWALLTEDEKTSALINATEYMDNTYGNRYIGLRSTETQYLEFPRYIEYTGFGQAVSENEIPKKIKYAEIELALAYLSNSNSFFSNVEESGVKSKTDTVGPISQSRTFATPSNGFEAFNNRASKFLSPYICSTMSIPVVRV